MCNLNVCTVRHYRPRKVQIPSSQVRTFIQIGVRLTGVNGCLSLNVGPVMELVTSPQRSAGIGSSTSPWTLKGKTVKRMDAWIRSTAFKIYGWMLTEDADMRQMKLKAFCPTAESGRQHQQIKFESEDWEDLCNFFRCSCRIDMQVIKALLMYSVSCRNNRPPTESRQDEVTKELQKEGEAAEEAATVLQRVREQITEQIR